MKKAYDGSVLYEKATKKHAEDTAAVKCRDCDAVHPAKYKLKTCPVCGGDLTQAKR